MITDNAVQELVESLKSTPQDTNSTYSAVVSRVDEENVVWVNLVGSDKETPTASASSEVKAGDVVTVEWRNNRLYIVGNNSNPSAGVIRVGAVEAAANTAREAANSAVADAGRAREAADSAVETAKSVEGTAKEASDYAEVANTSASEAKKAAATAYTQLSIVEDVVGVLNLIAEKGDYIPTVDETPQENKWYFKRVGSGTTEEPYRYEIVSGIESVYHLTSDTAIEQGKPYYTRSGTGTEEDPYVYTAVETPVVEDIGTYYEKYYELSDIHDSIRNYVSSHLVLDERGLWLMANSSGSKVLISAVQGDAGVYIYNDGDEPIAQYGDKAIIGQSGGFHIEIDGNEIGFYNGDSRIEANRVAFMNGSELYVANSLSFGTFSFVQRDNGHFTLKLLS